MFSERVAKAIPREVLPQTQRGPFLQSSAPGGGSPLKDTIRGNLEAEPSDEETPGGAGPGSGNNPETSQQLLCMQGPMANQMATCFNNHHQNDHDNNNNKKVKESLITPFI